MTCRFHSLRKLLSWMKRHPKRTLLLVLLAGFIAINVLAYRHAYLMLNYSDATTPTASRTDSIWQKAGILIGGIAVPRPQISRTPQSVGLDFETLRFSTTGGATLEAWRIVVPNSKGTVILFHGYSTCKSALLEVGKAITEMGYSTILVDFRGHGGSDGSDTTFGYREAEDVAAAVKYVRTLQGPGPLMLFGHSMGGAAILRSIAVHDVRVDGIILESVFARMSGAVRNRFALLGVPSFPGAELLLFWGSVQMGFNGFHHDPEAYAEKCNCPALFLHGAQDRHARPQESQAIANHIPESKEVVIFDSGGHTDLIRNDPVRWNESVKRFLKSITASLKSN